NQCGARLDENRALRDADGRAKLHADIAHPINSACREVIQGAVIKAFQDEKERAKQPGYVCRYDDYDAEDDDYGAIVQELNQSRKPDGYATHAPHGNRPTNPPHTSPQEARATIGEERNDRSFGEGIF